ncbi:hypothetical protein ILUMI_14959 [Ignelater luminosus]|uniref:Reverse transcriptase domain-containing protein n=1 Tax=Ignelater luminosus TaxID=2038154 RepID=A0A8K0CRG3_IGNLU|nr:hypothetical protein ILUMI_14959 [Ignelater luminosus]
MAPLTYELNRVNCGYQIKNENAKVSNLLYMDDLKIFGKNVQELKKKMKVIQTYSTDIGMEMGLEKCAKVTFKRGERVKSEDIEVGGSDLSKELGENEAYKYLGMNESRGIDETQVKDRLRREYIKRVRKVLKRELNSKNRMLAIGEIAVPVLQYSFGVVNWKIKELENIDRETRKMLTTYKMHHLKADVDCLYTSRKDGGRGLMQVVGAYKAAIINLSYYLHSKENDKYVGLIKRIDQDLPAGQSIMKIARKISEEIQIEESGNETAENPKNKIKNKILEQIKNKWVEKQMHGQHPRAVQEHLMDKEQTYEWLHKGELKGETESLVIVAQDQAINIRYHKKNILRQNVNSKCRLCEEYEKTTEHIIAGCTILAKHEYIKDTIKSVETSIIIFAKNMVSKWEKMV